MVGRVVAQGSNIRISTENAVAATATTVTGSSEDPEYPATNIKRPGRPFSPWKMTAATDQNVVINFGSAVTLSGVILVRCNFTSVRIQANSSDSWGAPPIDQLYTVTRSPFNSRYQFGVKLAAATFQYLRIFIPAGTTTDGAAGFLLGGVWAGAFESLPQNFRFDVNLAMVQPLSDVAPQHQGWRQRLIMGEPLCRMAAMRSSRITQMMPGFSDDLNKWQDIARRVRLNDTMGIILGEADHSQSYVVRPINEAHWQWTRRRLLRAESPWELEESITT